MSQEIDLTLELGLNVTYHRAKTSGHVFVDKVEYKDMDGRWRPMHDLPMSVLDALRDQIYDFGDAA